MYLGDILIFSKSHEEHLVYVRSVLRRLENKLYVKAEKCEFYSLFLTLDTFSQRGRWRQTQLRFVQWRSGIFLSPMHLQCFLGFTNFCCRFIHNSSQVATTLTNLISTMVPFLWSSEADTTFTKLKHLFTSAPVLFCPDTSKPSVTTRPTWERALEGKTMSYSPQLHEFKDCAYWTDQFSKHI